MNNTTQPVQQQQEKCYVLHIGSYDMKYGSADFDTPKSIPSCVAFPVPPRPYDEMLVLSPKKEKKKQTAREKQLLRLRGQFLVDRGLMSKDSTENEAYFEQITVHERKELENQNGYHGKHMHSPTRHHRNLPIHNLLNDNATFNQFTTPVLHNVIVGQDALEKCREEDVPKSSVEYELFYPIWRGRLNVDRTSTSSIEKVLDALEAIWAYIFNQRLDLSQSELERTSVVLVVPDQMIDQSAGIELQFLLNILFNRLKLAKVFIHRETVAATYGAGISNVCVVDMGESKTTVSVVDDGELICRSDYNCGGYHIMQTLLWILYQSKLPIEGLSTDIHINDREALREVMEKYCTGEQKIEEVFRTVELKHYRDGKQYKMEVGDPLHIAVLAYFFPKLVGKNKQQGPIGVIINQLSEGDTQEDYSNSEKNHFYSSNNLKELTTPTKYGMETDDNGQSETKKRRVATKQKGVTKQKAKVVPGLDRVIVKMLKKSGMEFKTGKQDKEAKKQKVNILLVGGCSQIKEFGALLKSKLEEYLTTKLKALNCVVHISTNDRDRGTNVRFLSWTGGCVLNQLEASKEMWITREEYSSNGIKSVLERAPL